VALTAPAASLSSIRNPTTKPAGCASPATSSAFQDNPGLRTNLDPGRYELHPCVAPSRNRTRLFLRNFGHPRHHPRPRRLPPLEEMIVHDSGIYAQFTHNSAGCGIWKPSFSAVFTEAELILVPVVGLEPTRLFKVPGF
jgi:hypothetical protein